MNFRFSARWRRLMKIPHETRNILGSIAQGWQRNRKDAEAIIQVRAKMTVLDGGLEIVVGRGDDTHVDSSWLRGSHALELAFLQHPQQLGLHVCRQIADFIEKERSSVCHLEAALSYRHRAGERAALVTE